jgi:YggT family protein
MTTLINPVSSVLLDIIEFYKWLVIIAAIMSWLVAFNVINTHNRVVYMIGDFLYKITEPALRPLRRFIPNLGGIDITPVVLYFILVFVQQTIIYITYRF